MYSRGGYKRAFALATAAAIGCVGILVGADGHVLAKGSPGPSTEIADSTAAAALTADVRAAAADARQHRRIPRYFRPRLAGIAKLADLGGCDYKRPIRRLCERGDIASDRSIVVFGDSHARHWIPAVDKAAIRHGYAAYFLVKPGCNASEMRRAISAGARACDSFRAWALRQIRSLRPDLLVVAGDVPEVALEDHGRKVHNPAALARLYARGVARHIRSVAEAVDQIVVLADTPDRQVTPEACITRRGSDLGDCAFRPDHEASLELGAARRIAANTSARLVNPRSWFCSRNLCPVMVGAILTYRDLEHMTTVYSGKLAPAMATALRLEDR